MPRSAELDEVLYGARQFRSIYSPDIVQQAVTLLAQESSPQWDTSKKWCQGRFERSGQDDGLVKVIAPIENTPAEKAGLASGDRISHVDGNPIKGLSLHEAVRRMRGRPGTSIRLMIQRAGKSDFEVTLVRAMIKVRAVRWRTVGRVGYIRVSRFSERVEGGVVQALTLIHI